METREEAHFFFLSFFPLHSISNERIEGKNVPFHAIPLRCQIGSIDPVRRIGGYLLRIGRFGARMRRGKNSPWTRWDEPISGKISRVLRFASIWITKRFTSVRLSRRHGNARWRFPNRVSPVSFPSFFSSLETLPRYGNQPDRTHAFLRGTSWERRFLRARYTRQSDEEQFFQSPLPPPPTWNFKFYFFFSLFIYLFIYPSVDRVVEN